MMEKDQNINLDDPITEYLSEEDKLHFDSVQQG